jgi:site-specific recombinase XerD
MSAHDNPAFKNLDAGFGSENALFDLDSMADSGSDNTQRRSGRRRVLPEHLEAIHADYVTALAGAPMMGQTPRTYGSQVRGYLAWLAESDRDAAALTDPSARDGAVRDYRAHLQTVLRRQPTTINLALAAIGDFYLRSGLGTPKVARLTLTPSAPKALDPADHLRWLREVERCQPRDRVLAYLGRYAGLRISERCGLNVADVKLSARKGVLVVWGKGGKYREVPAHPLLHEELTRWIYEERPAWPGADDSDALLLNARGKRLGTRGADRVLGAIATAAGVGQDYSTHVDRHGFATELLREKGVDIVLVAELLGHARLEDTRRYTLPTADEKAAAVAGLTVDR